MSIKSNLKKSSIYEIGCLVFIFFMFLIFPVFFTTDFYFNLNISKLLFFIGSEIILLIFVLFGLLCKKTDIKNLNFVKTDLAMMGLCVVSILSGFASQYFPSTLIGVNGRYNGVLIIVMYSVMYFIITLFLKNSFEQIFLLLAFSSFFVYFLGILNCFGIDPFHAFDKIIAEQKSIFISTIGNRNFFSTFICISLPIFVVMFCKLKSKGYVVFYGIVMLLGFFALYCSNTDSGFVGLFFALASASLFLINDITCFRKYLISILAMIFSGIVFYNVSQLTSGFNLVHSGMLKTLNNNFVLVFMAILLVIAITLTHISPISKSIEKNINKIKIIIFSIYAIIVVLCILLFVWCSFMNGEFNIEGIDKYFKFSHSWGSYRGSAWICLLSIIPMLNLFQILFGTGPDTIKFIFYKYYSNEIKSSQVLNFDSAHNEYLHYLITIGFLGCLMYLFLVSCVIYYGFKMAKTSKYSLACVLSVLAYAVQGIFNISMISTTPLFFIIFTLIVSQYRNSFKKS